MAWIVRHRQTKEPETDRSSLNHRATSRLYKWTIKLVFEAVPGSSVEHELGIIERAEEISPATVGLTIAEGKALLAGLQEQVVTAQV
jgi:hypothetical protein